MVQGVSLVILEYRKEGIKLMVDEHNTPCPICHFALDRCTHHYKNEHEEEVPKYTELSGKTCHADCVGWLFGLLAIKPDHSFGDCSVKIDGKEYFGKMTEFEWGLNTKEFEKRIKELPDIDIWHKVEINIEMDKIDLADWTDSSKVRDSFWHFFKDYKNIIKLDEENAKFWRAITDIKEKNDDESS